MEDSGWRLEGHAAVRAGQHVWYVGIFFLLVISLLIGWVSIFCASKGWHKANTSACVKLGFKPIALQLARQDHGHALFVVMDFGHQRIGLGSKHCIRMQHLVCGFVFPSRIKSGHGKDGLRFLPGSGFSCNSEWQVLRIIKLVLG